MGFVYHISPGNAWTKLLFLKTLRISPTRLVDRLALFGPDEGPERHKEVRRIAGEDMRDDTLVVEMAEGPDFEDCLRIVLVLRGISAPSMNTSAAGPKPLPGSFRPKTEPLNSEAPSTVAPRLTALLSYLLARMSKTSPPPKR